MSKVTFRKDNSLNEKTKKMIEEMKKKREEKAKLFGNKCGKGPSLTWLLIGLLVGMTVIVLSITSYQGILENNGGSIGDNYSVYYSELEGYYDNSTQMAEDLNDQGLLDKIFSGVGAALNTFVVGLSAIGQLFNMIPLIGGMIETLNNALPGFTVLFSLAFLVTIVYISMKYIQAKRGTSEEA